MASVETSVGTAIPAEPCSVAAGSGIFSSVSSRCVFSIVTVEFVDQNTDRERQAAERHGVERVAKEVEHNERGQDRERYGDHDHDRRSPGAEEQQDHHRRQRGRDRALADHAGDRRFDEHRLVEQLIDFEARRGRGAGDGLSTSLTPFTTSSVDALPFLMTLSRTAL